MVPGVASHDNNSSRSSGHTGVTGVERGPSVLVGPHKKPHKENGDQDNCEVEEQLPGRPLHLLSCWVRTPGRLLRAHQGPLA